MTKKFRWRRVSPQLEYLSGTKGNHTLSCKCPVHTEEYDLLGIKEIFND